ncbi:hypothetical protein FEM03_04745 [Phragmitibacter flavus]|uniref:Uncharacterized protein n=2 Tax=Phragmitibacter flavus TaxID=2576071 RepID=A0A5R8KI89_9BACT|nr:hypothetical protein FEM03_04745 [Phragmitibacter flavus]
MAFLKRFEIWVLLAVVIAGLAWVFLSGPPDEFDEEVLPTEPGKATVSSPALTLRKLVIKRDYGNARLDVDVKLRNEKSEKLVLTSPAVRLMNGAGREVPSFFLPFDALPEVAAKSTQEAHLRYWLEEEDLLGTLTLEIDGLKLLLKDGTAVPMDSLKNGEETVLKSTKWTLD